MALIALHDQTNSDVLVIPGLFVDKYLPSASGTDVKVYIYTFRALQAGSFFSLSSLSDTLELSEKEILRSLSYWEQCGLMRLSFGSDHSLNTISFLSPEQVQTPDSGVFAHSMSRLASRGNTAQMAIPAPVLKAVGTSFSGTAAAEIYPFENQNAPYAPQGENLPAKAGRAGSEAQQTGPAPTPAGLSSVDIASLDSDPEYAMYLLAWQRYFPQPFTYTDTEKIGYWYLRFSRSGDLMDYLIDYCASNGHANTRYMEKVAAEWFAKGYRTAEQAREGNETDTRLSYAVMKAFGLYGQKPAPAQLSFIQTWSREYGFSEEMILLACNRTIDKLQKADFKYADGILKSWHDSSVTTPQEAAAQDEAHKKSMQSGRGARKKGQEPEKPADSSPKNIRQFHNFTQRDTDYDAILLGKK